MAKKENGEGKKGTTLIEFFDKHDAIESEMSALQLKLEELTRQRSEVIRAFVEERGSNGPYKHPSSGRLLRAICRKETAKDDDGKSYYVEGGKQTYFLSGPRDAIITE